MYGLADNNAIPISHYLGHATATELIIFPLNIWFMVVLRYTFKSIKSSQILCAQNTSHLNAASGKSS